MNKNIILFCTTLLLTGCATAHANPRIAWQDTGLGKVLYTCDHPNGADILWLKNNSSDWAKIEYYNPPDREHWTPTSLGPNSEASEPLADCHGTLEFRWR